MYVSSVVILMWCTSVSYQCLIGLSMNSGLCKTDYQCCVIDGCVALCFIHSVASVVAARDMLVRELRPDFGSG